ncbi:11463_t:CDS:1, partial [Funneliformis caledonium]
MKKYLSTEKSKQKELSQPKTSKESSSSRKHEVKHCKYRNNPDPKWMDN